MDEPTFFSGPVLARHQGYKDEYDNLLLMRSLPNGMKQIYVYIHTYIHAYIYEAITIQCNDYCNRNMNIVRTSMRAIRASCKKYHLNLGMETGV